MQFSISHSFLFHLFLLFLSCFVATTEASKKQVSALYVFGDSTVDPGNNNFIDTPFKSNFPPYGTDFVNHFPTGRFTNGKLGTDFIASYLGLKELLPPYLDPNLSDKELVTGVSFASAGSGFDPLTPILADVIPIRQQLEYFKEYRRRLEGMLGKERTESHINNAFFFISAGTNDYVINYFAVPTRRKSYTPLTYRQFLLQHIQDFVQLQVFNLLPSELVGRLVSYYLANSPTTPLYDKHKKNLNNFIKHLMKDLWKEGARKIAFVGLPPMGCLPVVITVHSHNLFLERGCVEMYSAVARDHNIMLQHELFSMQQNFSNVSPGAKISYVDIYGPLDEMIKAHQIFGFDEVNHGCCGTGYIEATFLCNEFSSVCSDRSKFVFWDSIHPTEKAYYDLFRVSRSIIDALVN